MFDSVAKRLIRQYVFVLGLVLFLAFFTVFIIFLNGNLVEINNSLRFNEFENGPPHARNAAITYNSATDYNSNYIKNSDDVSELYYYSEEKGKYFSYDGYYYAQSNSNGQKKIVDISQEVSNMLTLFFTLLLVFIAIIIIIYIIFKYLINITLQPLKESNDAQKQFVSDVSHEIKTPLAVIQANLQSLEIDNTEDKQIVDYSIGEVKRLNKLTENLLFLNISYNTNLNKNKLNLKDQIDFVLANYEVKLFEEGIKLHADYKDYYIEINEDYFKQLIYILLDNAVKYCDSNKEISITSHENEISIKNTSEVIDEYDLQKLQNRFYQIDTSRNTKGFGLGLSIASKIADLNDYELVFHFDDGNFIAIIVIN